MLAAAIAAGFSPVSLIDIDLPSPDSPRTDAALGAALERAKALRLRGMHEARAIIARAEQEAQQIIEQANSEAAAIEQIARKQADSARLARRHEQAGKRLGARVVCPHCGDRTWRNVSTCEWCAKRLPEIVRTRRHQRRPLSQRQVQEQLVARGLATEKASA